MIVLKRTEKGYRQDPTKYFKFERFQQQYPNFVLIEGAFDGSDRWSQFDLPEERLRELRKNRLVRLEFEEPNKFFLGDDTDSYDPEFHRIFTLCPYTTEWLNRKHGNQRRVPIFFPFNENDIPPRTPKLHDIIYTGHLVSRTLMRDLRVMSAFNHRFVSNDPHPLVTNRGVGYGEKLQLISQSRITLVHNLLCPIPRQVRRIWRYDGWEDNGAFRLVPRRREIFRMLTGRGVMVPQLKSRLFEAAFCRSLILCKHDPFNVVERYFEPDREFVYYRDGELESKIRDILSNYPSYEAVIENAHERAAANYTTAAFARQHFPGVMADA